jgi:hypothetical protein
MFGRRIGSALRRSGPVVSCHVMTVVPARLCRHGAAGSCRQALPPTSLGQ